MRIRRFLRSFVVPLIGAAGLILVLPASPASADPPGNNGTVKIGEIDVDEGNANDPHVACRFELRFYNFDQGQTATITFSIHPPSGSPTELFSDNRLISDDPAGGGQDLDAVFVFDGAVDFDLGPFDRQPNQGYHVKLDIDVDGAGQKHKVFWLDCPPPKKHECPPKY
jgi:hypothetical protein